jgi:hypothetical protein
MAFTSDDLANICAAIASGELTVSVQGRTVTYRDMASLERAKAIIEADLRAAEPAASTRPRTRYFSFATQRERR